MTVCATAPTPASPTGKPSLIGLPREEFASSLAATGAEAFRAKQLWHWIYHRGATDFAAMHTIAGPMREMLAGRFSITRPRVASELLSQDGTRKWLLQFADGNKAETVFIPEEDRGTLCISSQVGCTLTCTFCHTGTQKLVRNLTAEEIVGQVMTAKDRLMEWPQKTTPLPPGEGSPPQGGPGEGPDSPNIPQAQPLTPALSRREMGHRLITNIVLMGMGEPLFNYDNVARAVKILMDHEGLSLSKRKITLSTSGVAPMIGRCGRELDVSLAISLHAVTDELRDEIVPINRKWPIAELLEACRNYPGLSNARRITFEYVMLKGVNDSDADAHALVKLLAGIPAKINLIPFNPWPGAPYECSSNNRIRAFAQIVNDAGYASPVRTPRGRDIFAACGQLKSDSERKAGEKVKLD